MKKKRKEKSRRTL